MKRFFKYVGLAFIFIVFFGWLILIRLTSSYIEVRNESDSILTEVQILKYESPKRDPETILKWESVSPDSSRSARLTFDQDGAILYVIKTGKIVQEGTLIGYVTRGLNESATLVVDKQGHVSIENVSLF